MGLKAVGLQASKCELLGIKGIMAQKRSMLGLWNVQNHVIRYQSFTRNQQCKENIQLYKILGLQNINLVKFVFKTGHQRGH